MSIADPARAEGDLIARSGAYLEPATERRRHVPGEAGLWVFILGDLIIFAVLFGVFVYYRARQPHLFAQSQQDLHRYFGAANTLLLLTSSLCVATAIRAIRRNMRRLAPALIMAAMICGLVFLVNKGIEWDGLLSHGHTPTSNNFFLYFFVLTGIHAVHVVIGMGVLSALFVLSRKERLTKWQYVIVEGGACFWHMVDLLWIVLFALLYLVH
jgi:nitric oxide reductase NorE protein